MMTPCFYSPLVAHKINKKQNEQTSVRSVRHACQTGGARLGTYIHTYVRMIVRIRMIKTPQKVQLHTHSTVTRSHTRQTHTLVTYERTIFHTHTLSLSLVLTLSLTHSHNQCDYPTFIPLSYFFSFCLFFFSFLLPYSFFFLSSSSFLLLLLSSSFLPSFLLLPFFFLSFFSLFTFSFLISFSLSFFNPCASKQREWGHVWPYKDAEVPQSHARVQA